MDGIGAYPWHTSRNIVINFQNGEVIRITDLFEKNTLKRLASIIDEFVQIDIKKALLNEKYTEEIPYKIESNLNENEEENNVFDEWYRSYKFTVVDFDDFYFNEYGITFCYNFGFPHAIKSLEPEGHYFFSFSSLKQFIKKDSVFEKFILNNE